MLCIACLGILSLNSCKDRKLYRQLEEFSGREVVIPETMLRVDYSNRGTVDYGDKKALLVVYVDSVECASCRIKGMFRYGNIIDFATDSISGFAPMFIFSPRKQQLKDVRQTLEYSGLDYPALLDENGSFPRENPHIPADNRFHTFLLDNDRKVVLVGDPSANPTLWELYKTTIRKIAGNNGVLPE